MTRSGRSESDADIAAILRGYVDRFELTSPMVKQMMLDAAAEIERLRAALKPFALNVMAVSLRDALGHISREDLLRARAALEPKP